MTGAGRKILEKTAHPLLCMGLFSPSGEWPRRYAPQTITPYQPSPR